MSSIKKYPLYHLIFIFLAFSACEVDNFVDPNDPKFGLLEMEEQDSDTIPPFSTSQVKTSVAIDLEGVIPINKNIYGVNNDWRRITSGMFPAFTTALESINYQLLRFPGGFESEFYDWSENLTPGWTNTPNQPGADIETIKASNPNALSIVVPINKAMLQTLFSSQWNAAVDDLKAEAIEAITLTGPNNILSVEIGNEWWLQFAGQGVERSDKLIKYAEIAKRIAREIKTKFPTATFNLLVNGDYTQPEEFGVIKTIFGTDINDINGLALHTYTGYDSDSHDIRQLQSNIDACQENLGKNYLSLSEWAPSKAYNENKIYAQGANLLVEQMYEHALAEADEAAFWPPQNPGIPGLGLFNFNLDLAYPTAQLFGDMATDFQGHLLKVIDGSVRAAAAIRNDDTIVVYVVGKDKPFTTVTLNVGREIESIISSTLWEPGDLTNTAAVLPMINTSDTEVFKNGQNLILNVNRNSAYTIHKVIFSLEN